MVNQWFESGVHKLLFGVLLFCITGFLTWLTNIYISQNDTRAEVAGIKIRQEERYVVIINRLDRIENKLDRIR